MRALPAFFLSVLILVDGASAQAPPASGKEDAHAASALRLMQALRYSEAAAEFEQALANDANNDPLRIEYATCLFAEEKTEESRRQFEIVRQRLGVRPDIDYYLGLLDLRTDNFTEAIAKLQPLESSPAFPKACFYLGLAYLSAGQTGAAMESLERAARNNPQDPEVHYRLGRVYSLAGRPEEAEREYTFYRNAREGQRLVEEEVPACNEALRTKPIAEARDICQRLADPNDSRRLILLGQLYADAGAFEEAVGPLSQAARLDANSFEAWHYLGVTAEHGAALAQYNLGTLYVFGQGVPVDYAEAAKWFRKAADQGLAEAQHNLGVAYRDGKGVTQDLSEAVAWFRKAANQGFSEAQFNLAVMYSSGQGVPKAPVEAAAWLRKSADQNYAPAEFNMGVVYAAGTGVERDLAQAVAWYRKAAEAGLPQAQDALRNLANAGYAPAEHVLGVTYEKGWGSAKIEPEAVYWYRKAAELEYPQAEYDLGRMLAEGRGVLKNENEAKEWFRRAAAKGMPEAQSRLDALDAPH